MASKGMLMGRAKPRVQWCAERESDIFRREFLRLLVEDVQIEIVRATTPEELNEKLDIVLVQRKLSLVLAMRSIIFND